MKRRAWGFDHRKKSMGFDHGKNSMGFDHEKKSIGSAGTRSIPAGRMLGWPAGGSWVSHFTFVF